MSVNKILLSIIFLFSSVLAMGQGFVYSYNDPCTSKIKQIYINTPNDTAVLTYGGEIRVFTYEELQTNAVQDWINSINSQNPNGPCTGLGLQLNTTINSLVAQNSISVLTSVFSVLTDIDSEDDDEEDDKKKIKKNKATETNEQSSTQLVLQQTNIQNTNQSNNQAGSSNPNNQISIANSNNQSTTTNSVNQEQTVSSNNNAINNQNQIVSNSYNNQIQTVSNNTNISNKSNNNEGNNNSQNTNNSNGMGTRNIVGNSNNIDSNKGTSDSKGDKTVNDQIGGSNQDQRNINTITINPTTTGKQQVESTLTTNQTSNNSISTNNQNIKTENNQQQNISNNNQTSSVSNQNNVTGNQTSTNDNNSGITNITGAVNSIRFDNTEQSDTKDKNKDGVNNALTSLALNSASVKNKASGAKKGNLIMNGDIVVIGSATGADPSQFRFNGSIVSSNTKNTFAKGALINFTSYINNSNVTLFVSYRYKKFTSILANSTMMNFDKDLFNTVSIMESYKYRKVTTTLGLNLTSGNLGSSKFQSISMLGGVFSDFKINKKIKMTTMFVMVYSPYVYYYQGMWYDSGYLAIPFVSGDYKITKKFKLNISFSGVQQLNDKPLTYQILTGAKAIL